MVSASARRRRREASAAADADNAAATDAANDWTHHAHAEDERRQHLERNPQLRKRMQNAREVALNFGYELVNARQRRNPGLLCLHALPLAL